MFIGCQFSLYAMSDDFAEIILEAVRDLGRREKLRVEPDDISTLIVGPTEEIFRAVQDAFTSAAATGKHVVGSVTFSRGCPGEPDDPICTPESPQEGSGTKAPDPRTAAKTGITTAAQFSLYPLGVENYMTLIGDEIERAKEAGIFTGGKHFCTRLDGDCGAVIATMQSAFDRAGEQAGHVVVTATLSANSPSSRGGAA